MNAPSTFQLMMDIILAGISFFLVYLQDVVVFSISYEEHLHHLLSVFQVVGKHALKLNISKYSFVQPKLELLGRVVNVMGLYVDPSKIEAIKMY